MLKALPLLVFCAATQAQVTDTWSGKDKRDHLTISAAIAVATTPLFDIDAPIWKPIFLCMVPGLAKEAYDARRGGPGNASAKDLIADLAGCTLGTYAMRGLFLSKDHKGLTIGLTKQF